MAELQSEECLSRPAANRLAPETRKERLSYSNAKARLSRFHLAFHDGVEIGPVMLAKIAKHTGLKPEDL